VCLCAVTSEEGGRECGFHTVEGERGGCDVANYPSEADQKQAFHFTFLRSACGALSSCAHKAPTFTPPTHAHNTEVCVVTMAGHHQHLHHLLINGAPGNHGIPVPRSRGRRA